MLRRVEHMPDLIEQLRGDLADRYSVERELGRGGMATVYLARDLKHHRSVAIKVLLPELAATVGSDRFLREIEIAAGLDHPHILPLYDSGEAGGLLFFVMPYVDGESLRDRLDREKQLPVEEAVRIATDLCEALSCAHERGVIHRDVKPANILLSEGHARIADFGIAGAVSAAGSERLTNTGLTVGTPLYMSPEQVSGEAEYRSDIYALACVLYEMLAGEPPLQGPTPRATSARRLTETPRPVHRERPAVPEALDHVLARALRPLPADRFSTASDFGAALRAAADPSATARTDDEPTGRSVAVLPFDNLSPDPGSEYFSDGITAELTSALAGVAGLRVAARTSAAAFKGQAEDVRTLGRKLNVGAILEGSVRKQGDRVRISAQLVNVADGYQLWSNRFDRRFEDIFAIQEEIAVAIVEALRVRLLPGAERSLGEIGTTSVAAYNLYLQGRFHLERRTWQAFERAAECFLEAIAEDPDYAQAHAGLADTYLLLERYGLMHPRAAFVRFKGAALRALRIDPGLAEVHVALAYGKMIFEWDAVGAEAEFRQAIQLNPDYAPARHLYAWSLGSRGRLDEALVQYDRILAAEPHRLISLTNRGTILYFGRQFEGAIEQLESVLDLDPAFAAAHQWLGRALEAAGRRDESIAAHRRALDVLGEDPESLASLAHALGGAGQAGEARRLVDRLAELGRSKYVSPYWLGLARLGLGETETGLSDLEQALEDRFDWLLFLEVDPIFDSLRSNPRFERLARRVLEEYDRDAAAAPDS